ncbi:unnamed protein product [Chrysoparadoxa australica]
MKRLMTSQVLMNWFWADIQKALAVGGGVAQPLRTWGLHATAMLVKEMEDNPTRFSQVQVTLQSLESIVDLLEAHFLGSWGSASGGSTNAAASLGLSDEPGLAAALAGLIKVLFPVLQTLDPGRSIANKFLGMLHVLSSVRDTRVRQQCLGAIELLAMFSPHELTPALPRAIKSIKAVLAAQHRFSPACVKAAASCLKVVANRVPEEFGRHQVQVDLFCCLESIMGECTWGGAPFWRGVVLTRDIEMHYMSRAQAVAELQVTIELIATYDQAGHRAIHWLLFGRSLILGTGHLSRPSSPRLPTAAPGDGSGGGGAIRDCFGMLQAARRELAELAAPLAGARWQVKLQAVRCCLSTLATLQLAAHHSGGMDCRLTCQDVVGARVTVNEALTAASVTGGEAEWSSLPQFVCLYMDDLLSMACTAATASTHDSELLELQEAGVRLLTAVVRAFAQAPDPDLEKPMLTTINGKQVRVRARLLEQSISQISSAVRPALSSNMSSSLALHGCELMVLLAQHGLVKDAIVFKRLIRQALPAAVKDGKVVTAPCSNGDNALNGKSSGPPLPLLRPPQSPFFALRIVQLKHLTRLHALALLYLIGTGMNPLELSCGSCMVPDSMRKGLHEALRDKLPVLQEHWVAQCRDAVRVLQGRDEGVWPTAQDTPIIAGLTFPPGVNVDEIRRSSEWRWPSMAAAAAGLCRSSGDAEACTLVYAACSCGLRAVKDKLARRRSSGSGRHQGQGVLPALVREDRDVDEGVAAEEVAIYYLEATKRVFPGPTSSSSDSDSAGLSIPLAAVVHMLETLADGPWLFWGEGMVAGATQRLQVSAVAVVMSHISGEGGAVLEGLAGGDENGAERLWEALLRCVMGSFRLASPWLLEEIADEVGGKGERSSSEGLLPLLPLLEHLPRHCPASQWSLAMPELLSLALRLLHRVVVGHGAAAEEGEGVGGSAAENVGEGLGAEPSVTCQVGAAAIGLLRSVSCVRAVDTKADGRTDLLASACQAVNEMMKGLVMPWSGKRALPVAALALKAIEVVLEGWAVLVYACPGQMQVVSKPLQELLVGDSMPAALRCKLLEGVRVAFQAWKDEPSRQLQLLRHIGPYTLTALDVEVQHVVNASQAPLASTEQACLAEGVKVAIVAISTAPEDTKAALVSLLLPQLAALLRLNAPVAVPAVATMAGQALLHLARTCSVAFKEQVLLLSPGERQCLEHAVRGAMAAQAPQVQQQQAPKQSLKLDLKQYMRPSG